MESFGKQASQDRRKKKEANRRVVKEERKNRLREKAVQLAISKDATFGASDQKLKEITIKKQREQANKEQITPEFMAEMSFAQKITILKTIKNEVISFPAYRYRKIRDLLTFCEDPKDVDVVLKAVSALAEVFCDILPSYKIRELGDKSQPAGEESKAAKQSVKISKEIEALQTQEQYTLKCYKDYLQVLEVFSKLKVGKMSKNSSDTVKASIYYGKLRLKSVECFGMLLERHPHFNYRMNILAVLSLKLSNQDLDVRNAATKTIKKLLRVDNNNLLDFKLEILKQLQQVLKTKSHAHMDPSLLNCLVLHEILVDEGQAKAVDASTKRSQQLHDQLTKLRKKGKYKEYRDVKQTLLSELKETDAIGLDLGKVSENNNAIIKQTLAIYFEVLKQHAQSVHIRSVFLGLPQFTQYVNLEIIWDLIAVMREYFKVELNESTTSHTATNSVSNILAGLLCAFQILDIGAGQAFNIEEKEFVAALYAVVQRMFEKPLPARVEQKDFIAFLQCMEIVFHKRKQLSTEIVNSFVKRLALIQMYLIPSWQAPVLLLIKSILNKYASARSSMLDFEDDSVSGGFSMTPTTSLYRADLNDPQLANAGQTQIVFELCHTYNWWLNDLNGASKTSVNLRLAKSILLNDSMPQDCLSVSPIQLFQKLTTQEQQALATAKKEEVKVEEAPTQ